MTLATRICAVVALLYAAFLVNVTAHHHGWPGTGRTVDQSGAYLDFVPIWTAGKLALEGRPLDAYDWTIHDRAKTDLLKQEKSRYQPWPYPPTFLAVAAALAMMPFGAAMMTWVLATWCAYAFAAARIVGSWRGAVILSASAAALYNAHVGQNGALSAALLGLGLVLVPTRPVLAGVCLGALSYKPHLAILVPPALALAGYWRTLAAAALTAAAMAAGATLLFGFEPWLQFLDKAPKTAALMFEKSPEIIQSLFGILNMAGVPPSAAGALHGAFTVVVAASVLWLWRQTDASYDIKAAALAAGAVVMSPYIFIYDLTLLMVAVAFLLRPAGRLDAIEIAGLIAGNILLLLSPAIHFPSGELASLIVLALVARRALKQPIDLPSSLRPSRLPFAAPQASSAR